MEMSECDIYPFVAGEDNDLAASGTKGFVVPTPEVKGHLETESVLLQPLCSLCLQLLIASFLSLSLDKTSHFLNPCALKTLVAKGMSKETQG